MLPKCSQNGPKWHPGGLWRPLGGRDRFQTHILSENLSHFGVKIGPKLVKNQPKIDAKTHFDLDIVFRTIFDRCRFEKRRPDPPKSMKNHWFFNENQRIGFSNFCTVLSPFWCQLASILVPKMVQNRPKNPSKTTSEF